MSQALQLKIAIDIGKKEGERKQTMLNMNKCEYTAVSKVLKLILR